ncbi:hypothetical protein SAMN03080602_03054 [Arenibacter troitsensis]|uniref:Uncharacterized protein n=1 Tax=Arenibacter troitsensis TaxID=188872 RepID=A0A1X7KK75_9FLAO|nr:hypothetical protein SAMN03080602_03054 [Arenibacter troitsensis]
MIFVLTFLGIYEGSQIFPLSQCKKLLDLKVQLFNSSFLLNNKHVHVTFSRSRWGYFFIGIKLIMNNEI